MGYTHNDERVFQTRSEYLALPLKLLFEHFEKCRILDINNDADHSVFHHKVFKQPLRVAQLGLEDQWQGSRRLAFDIAIVPSYESDYDKMYRSQDL